MTERELRRALRERPVPGEREAAERTLRVLRAAHAGGAPAAARRRPLLRPALALALALAALGTVLSPAGADVRRWIGDRLDPEPSPTLGRDCPREGRLLVSSAGGSWVVNADGSLRRLGDYSSAGWSPRGLYRRDGAGAAALRRGAGRDRALVDRPAEGRGPPGLVAGNGYRVAYLEGARAASGHRQRGRRSLAWPGRWRPVTPAWRPGRGLRAQLRDARRRPSSPETCTAGACSGRAHVGERPTELEWSARGERLVALTRDRRALLRARRRAGAEPEPAAPARGAGDGGPPVGPKRGGGRLAGRSGGPIPRPSRPDAPNAFRRRGALLGPRLGAGRPLAAGRLARRRPVGVHRLAGGAAAGPRSAPGDHLISSEDQASNT